ncbi:MAG: hypothetical protein U9Q04_05885 [Campylobacterota bacterium]|nr:hypothetical protein [Campylobacterota bacterium]
MLKWIALIIVAVVIYMIATGNMGGARDATQNYVDVRSQNTDEKAIQGREAPIHKVIEYNQQQKNK